VRWGVVEREVAQLTERRERLALVQHRRRHLRTQRAQCRRREQRRRARAGERTGGGGGGRRRGGFGLGLGRGAGGFRLDDVPADSRGDGEEVGGVPEDLLQVSNGTGEMFAFSTAVDTGQGEEEEVLGGGRGGSRGQA